MCFVGYWQVSSRLELWGDELQRTEPPRDPQQAEQALAAHNESVARMQHATFQVNNIIKQYSVDKFFLRITYIICIRNLVLIRQY